MRVLFYKNCGRVNVIRVCTLRKVLYFLWSFSIAIKYIPCNETWSTAVYSGSENAEFSLCFSECLFKQNVSSFKTKSSVWFYISSYNKSTWLHGFCFLLNVPVFPKLFKCCGLTWQAAVLYCTHTLLLQVCGRESEKKKYIYVVNITIYYLRTDKWCNF